MSFFEPPRLIEAGVFATVPALFSGIGEPLCRVHL
jgi:hypothetical protein